MHSNVHIGFEMFKIQIQKFFCSEYLKDLIYNFYLRKGIEINLHNKSCN